MKFTDSDIETQNALFAATISEAINVYTDNHGQKEGDEFASGILKNLGLNEKEFMSLFNPDEKTSAEIEAVTGIKRGMFHTIRPVRIDPQVEEFILNNQCGEYPSYNFLRKFAIDTGIIEESMLVENDFTNRCLIAEQTHRYNLTHGTSYGMTDMEPALRPRSNRKA